MMLSLLPCLPAHFPVLQCQGTPLRLVQVGQQCLPCGIGDPIPVCILSHVLTQLPQWLLHSMEGEWLIGLAINSYLQSTAQELMYVVLLDDGNEIHLPHGEVDYINITY